MGIVGTRFNYQEIPINPYNVVWEYQEARAFRYSRSAAIAAVSAIYHIGEETVEEILSDYEVVT